MLLQNAVGFVRGVQKPCLKQDSRRGRNILYKWFERSMQKSTPVVQIVDSSLISRRRSKRGAHPRQPDKRKTQQQQRYFTKYDPILTTDGERTAPAFVGLARRSKLDSQRSELKGRQWESHFESDAPSVDEFSCAVGVGGNSRGPH